jgi:hypothetical protein
MRQTVGAAPPWGSLYLATGIVAWRKGIASFLLSFAFEKAKLVRSLDTSGPVVAVSNILLAAQDHLAVDDQGLR